MERRRVHRALAAAAAVLTAGAGLAGCASSARPPVSPASSAVSAAQSALASGASQFATAASGLASQAASALASAESAASSALAGVKGGLNATGDVTVGSVVRGSDGTADAPVTVTNHQSKPSRYTIEVDFKDQSGKLLDAVVVNIPELAPGATTEAAARSHRELPGQITAVVGLALRY
ncbi:hypothetical protein [Kitasatospora sp. HPMI-4]|uniref:hypothetical protein n=1 Tax=Kitasatospora sp. HPMI-4 TaxID=3448443 RepID=UPI003F1A0F8B